MIRGALAHLSLVALALMTASLERPCEAADSRIIPATPVSTQSVKNGDTPSVRPTQTPSTADFENTPIPFSENPQSRVRPRGEARSLPSIFSLLFYVFVICGIFILILWLVKRYVPGHRQLFSHPALEILGRSHLDQKRYISLLRVGKPIIVLGVAPDEITALSEITDETEITEIMELARPKSESGLNIFQRLFQKHAIEAEQEERRMVISEQSNALLGDIRSLRGKVGAGGDSGGLMKGIDRIG